MISSSKPTKPLDRNVYVGVPITNVKAGVGSRNKKFGCTDWAAYFLLGVVLGCVSWVMSLGWGVISLFTVGPVSWTSVGSILEHLLFDFVGITSTLIVFLAVTKLCFSGVLKDDEDDDSDVEDVHHTLGDSCGLGFLLTHFVLEALFAKHLLQSLADALGCTVKVDHMARFYEMFVALLMSWIIIAQIQGYSRAVKRANGPKPVPVNFAYSTAQIV